jgi:regulator of protease activity HflC (stomatin/prohibitin superfamily)
MKEDNTMRNALIIGASFLVSLVIINAVVGPLYNVWAQSLQGKAELQKAEYTRQVAVLEAQAKKDSAQQLADAEIIRAGGVAKANEIIGNSLKDNREYLQYLYITGIEEGSQKGNVTIYVPTEGGMPVPTLQMNKWTVSMLSLDWLVLQSFLVGMSF